MNSQVDTVENQQQDSAKVTIREVDGLDFPYVRPTKEAKKQQARQAVKAAKEAAKSGRNIEEALDIHIAAPYQVGATPVEEELPVPVDKTTVDNASRLLVQSRLAEAHLQHRQAMRTVYNIPEEEAEDWSWFDLGLIAGGAVVGFLAVYYGRRYISNWLQEGLEVLEDGLDGVSAAL